MNKKYVVLLVASVFILVSCVCVPGFRRTNYVPPQTLDVSEAMPAASDTPAKLNIFVGAGKVSLKPGSPEWVTGTITYLGSGWKPEILRDGNRLDIKQAEGERISTRGKYVSEWDLSLGDQVMDLSIKTGASDSVLDLSGVPINDLVVESGASKTILAFNKANPVSMDSFTFSSGAADVELINLTNANFRQMDFNGGLGSYKFDFGGDLQQDATVNIKGGAGKFSITVPADLNIEIRLKEGVSNVTSLGDWAMSDNAYKTDMPGNKLTVNIEIGIGQLELIRK